MCLSRPTKLRQHRRTPRTGISCDVHGSMLWKDAVASSWPPYTTTHTGVQDSAGFSSKRSSASNVQFCPSLASTSSLECAQHKSSLCYSLTCADLPTVSLYRFAPRSAPYSPEEKPRAPDSPTVVLFLSILQHPAIRSSVQDNFQLPRPSPAERWIPHAGQSLGPTTLSCREVHPPPRTMSSFLSCREVGGFRVPWMRENSPRHQRTGTRW